VEKMDMDLVDLVLKNKDLLYCYRNGTIFEEKETLVPLINLNRETGTKTLPPLIEENYDITKCNIKCYSGCPAYYIK
jgi:hypothetical protein